MRPNMWWIAAPEEQLRIHSRKKQRQSQVDSGPLAKTWSLHSEGIWRLSTGCSFFSAWQRRLLFEQFPSACFCLQGPARRLLPLISLPRKPACSSSGFPGDPFRGSQRQGIGAQLVLLAAIALLGTSISVLMSLRLRLTRVFFEKGGAGQELYLSFLGQLNGFELAWETELATWDHRSQFFFQAQRPQNSTNSLRLGLMEAFCGGFFPHVQECVSNDYPTSLCGLRAVWVQVHCPVLFVLFGVGFLQINDQKLVFFLSMEIYCRSGSFHSVMVFIPLGLFVLHPGVTPFYCTCFKMRALAGHYTSCGDCLQWGQYTPKRDAMLF